MSIPFDLIAIKTGFSTAQIKEVYCLLKNGATVSFIARYRKDRTGGIDENGLEKIHNQFEHYEKIKSRKKSILKLLSNLKNVSPSCISLIKSSWDISEIEDAYYPFKTQRKTKASVAIDAGLAELAKMILSSSDTITKDRFLSFKSAKFNSYSKICSGVEEILIKWISEMKSVRFEIRGKLWKFGKLYSRVNKNGGTNESLSKYTDYHNFYELVRDVKSHRFLAINRGRNEGALFCSIELESSIALKTIEHQIIKNQDRKDLICSAIKKAWSKSLKPSLQNEIFKQLKSISEQKSIEVFSDNLRQLLLQPPLKNKRLLAIDPGFKSGCKLVCLSEHGVLLANATVYPNPPKIDRKSASKKIISLINQYKLDGIALGNGTASRETEYFIKRIRFNRKVNVYIVNEAGASAYSTSTIGRQEFPNYDVNVRGAVSIGRRLIDPLSELVKIDPKSIGVGQYQHDVNQNDLSKKLNRVVSSVVNYVGVDLNTASEFLLSYVSGVGPQLAKKIVDFRSKNNGFSCRSELLNVPGLGKKSYENSAGFLRIKNGNNLMDDSAIHPEMYTLIDNICKKEKISFGKLIGNQEKIDSIDWIKYSTEEFQQQSIEDLKRELIKPGHDPRKVIFQLEFDSSIQSINDVKVGQILNGIVNNVTNFGAFVDIGIKENGLIHISNLANEFVDDPSKIIKLHQHLKVRVISVEKERKRIGLSLKDI